VADPKFIDVDNDTAYRYYAFKFADNWGYAYNMGVRRIELQSTEDPLVRRIIVLAEIAGLTSGRVPYCTTNGRLTDASGMTFNGTRLAVLVTLPAGTASAASLIFPSGVVLTTPAEGAEEADATRRYWTNAAAARKTYAWTDDIAILVGDTRRIILDYRNGTPSNTNGSGLWTRVEYPTNKVNQYTTEFVHTGTKSLEFTIQLPDDYNGGTITAKVWWSTTSVTGNAVLWSVQARVYHDGDALDAAWGTAQVIADTNLGADTRMISAATPAITIANTPAAGDELQVRIQRTPGEAADTLDDLVRLHRVVLFYTSA